MTASSKSPESRSALLADAALHRALKRMISAKVPGVDADDVLQATLADAIAAAEAPSDPEEIRRWVFGIARHKIADHHRKAKRFELSDAPIESEATSAPHSARELAEWVEGEAPDGSETEKTLEWMAREADGEKLEAIASEENVPAARVRQRVSRLRRFFRERWARELAALGVLALVLALFIVWWRGKMAAPEIAPERAERTPRALEDARALRDRALERCRARAFDECLKGLDEARALDPVGDGAEAVQDARAAARAALEPNPPEPVEPAPSASSPAPPSPSTEPAKTAPAPKRQRTSITSEPAPTAVPSKAPRDQK